MGPSELSRALVDAYNRRDSDAMRALFDPDIVYIRPGGVRRDGVDAIMAAYEAEWRKYDVEVRIRSALEDGERFAAEIEVVKATGDTLFVGSVFHEWRAGRLTSYRAYFDPPR